MTTEVAQQKRSHNAFLFMDGGGMADQRSSNRTTFCEVDRKRLKTGCTVSTKEKKDKIGERVAALQQLVSPFGKTDTASVLLDATEYVRFLHDQLRVLSAPYLRTTKTEGMQLFQKRRPNKVFGMVENMISSPSSEELTSLLSNTNVESLGYNVVKPKRIDTSA